MKNYAPNRVETDRFGHLVMSPWASARHGIYQSEVISLFGKLLPGGRTITECPVSTSDGVKLVDAAWMSRERFEPMREFSVFEKAPEICVEVISPSNTRAEMDEKRALYFEIGCLEFWTVDASGKVHFYILDGEREASHLCPAFPIRLEI